MRTSVVAALMLYLVAPPLTAAAQDRYVDAQTIENGDRIRIVSAAGRKIIITKAQDSAGFDKVRISPDGRSVGWVQEWSHLGPSYPLPLELVVYRNGRSRRFGKGLPVWRWAFIAGGERIAFFQSPVRSLVGHYELRDTATGRVLDAFDHTYGEPIPDAQKRAWVAEVDRDQ